MSAEGKKKRGESGRAKALANPFRLNGRPADWEARGRGCYTVGGAASSGSITMRGMLGGLLAQALGYPVPELHLVDRMLEHAQARCTHPLYRE